MESLKKLKPDRVWYYFEEISRFPRASREEKAVMDYIIGFAKDKGLEFKKDGAGNVVIVRPALKGFEDKPSVVLQSHVDMVCEKNEESAHDFSKDPIIPEIDGNWVKASGTTLGADNGIGMAVMLSILEDRTLQTGKIECLFTVEEETGLYGALGLDPRFIEGRILLNLDTEDVENLYVGCAGGKDSHITLPLKSIEPPSGMAGFQLQIKGLLGGHSGAEIHKGRANAIKLMARVMYHLKKSLHYWLSDLHGGDKHNAIPRETFSDIILDKSKVQQVKNLFMSFCESIKNEYRHTEPKSLFEIQERPIPERVFNTDSTVKAVNLLMSIPHGVFSISPVMDGLPETSTNLASVRITSNELHIFSSHRSSVDSALAWISDLHNSIAEISGAAIEQNAGYPGWNPDLDSRLLKYAKKAFYRVMGHEANIRAIHAGLECGVIKGRYNGMDALSLGPTVQGAHSPDERVNIESVQKFYEMLIEILKTIYEG